MEGRLAAAAPATARLLARWSAPQQPMGLRVCDAAAAVPATACPHVWRPAPQPMLEMRVEQVAASPATARLLAWRFVPLTRTAAMLAWTRHLVRAARAPVAESVGPGSDLAQTVASLTEAVTLMAQMQSTAMATQGAGTDRYEKPLER